MKVNIGKVVLEIVQGDITEQDTEVLVNAANNYLWMGSGVAGAIKRKGGDDIEREAMAQGPIEVGSAVLTSAGKLKARYVIHAAVMGQDLHTDAEKISKTTRATLTLVESKQIKSISFPALGTGAGGFSVYRCANIMISEVINFLQISKYLQVVRFVLFDKQTFDAFNDELKLQFSTKRH